MGARERLPHVLMVTPRLFYPALNGGEARIRSLLGCLSERYRFSLLTFLGPERTQKNMAAALSLERDLLHRVHFVQGKPQRTLGKSDWIPPYAQLFRSAEMAEELRSLSARGGVDIVHLEFNEMAQYAREVQGRVPVVLTEHDTSIFSPSRSWIREARDWRGSARSWDWRRQRSYARAVLSRCDRVVAVSEADRLRLGAFVPPGRVEVIATGVDLGLFPARGAEGRQADTLVYVGHYPHYPNEDAAVYFCQKILPRVARRVPAVRLRLVGSDPTAPVRALASRSVEVTGTVFDVAPHLARAQVFVAPLRLGHGIKGKLLEAFASGTPAVASPQACEGIPQAVHGKHLLIAAGPENFARQVARLLAEPSLRRRLAQNARVLVKNKFQWSRQADRLDRLYRDLLARPAGSGSSAKQEIYNHG